jgi:hypothetical protein
MPGKVKNSGLERAKSFRQGTLDAAEAHALVATHAKSDFGALRKVAKRAVAERVGGDYLDTDILFHKGKLTVAGDFSTAKLKPAIGVLLVDGDLVVEGRFEDSLDPESLVIVAGSLRAHDLISEGFLEVHGDLVVDESAVFLDNDGCAHVHGDLSARFLYTMYHSVKVNGRVQAKLATGDAKHISCKSQYEFIKECSQKMRGLVDRKLLEIIGDEDDDKDWCIDRFDYEKLVKMVRQGKSPLLPRMRA